MLKKEKKSDGFCLGTTRNIEELVCKEWRAKTQISRWLPWWPALKSNGHEFHLDRTRKIGKNFCGVPMMTSPLIHGE